MAKTSNRSSSDSNKQKKNNTKQNRSGPDAVAMKVKATKANPFETIWSRRKFDILGKKRKGEERRIGQARSKSIEKRKKTLLKEYEQSGKSSVFVDNRIGEQNDELDEFGKAIIRSQRELQLKLNKKVKYNLSDGEEEGEDFSDGLGAFPEKDDFEDEMLPDDEDEESASLKQINARNVQSPRDIGLMEAEENKHKSKKEVMEEIISKSKFFKAQKAKDKEENEHFMEELDKKFTSLVQSDVLLSLTDPSKMNALKALVNKSIPNEISNKGSSSSNRRTENFEQEKPDYYDKLVKEMALEMRARPSDRTKTPEEIAQEERERLEQLEVERQKRMVADDYYSDEDNEVSEKPSTQKPRSLSGDDLGDSFSLDEDAKTKKGWVDEVLGRKDVEDFVNEDGDSSENSESEDVVVGSDEELDEHEKNLSLKDWEQSETIKGGDDSSKARIKADSEQPSKQLDLPYLIEAPKTMEELCALLVNCSNSDIIVVINRIRGSNAIKLAAENRKKMQVFYGILLQYFAVLANKKPLNFELLNMLVKPLIEMSMELPYFAAICARQRILRTRTQFVETIKNPENSSWPSSKTLFLLRLWSLKFPSSDFRHAVMTPAILLMCEYLMRCSILSGREIAIGSFLCSMLLSVTRQSRKFCPEAIIFLRSLLMAATDSYSTSHQDSQFYHLMELRAVRPLLCFADTTNEIKPLNFLMVIDLPEDSSFFSSDNFRASVLLAIIETLGGYINIYDGLSSFPEIFLPISRLLLEVAQQKNMPNLLHDKLKDMSELINSKVDEHHTLRRPLQMRKQKPVPIKLLNPKFEENFVKGRDYDPDRERAEMRKLKKQMKREAKGAARELRKDNYFLFEVKEKDKALLEEERAAKYGKAKAFLQEQENAFKSGQLGKGRKRRR
ncbi:nucleolar protein 14 [Quillaja saponaria]|uniref:Nucleolar protein 14 n=1 Tax=Quillaja saponaria TaxID=32244 RepID=A0AAD7KPL1_QUISA|nr:nucleolar protein 14 [Quillaja saponaria]